MEAGKEQNIVSLTRGNRIKELAAGLGSTAGEDEEFMAAFTDELLASPEISEEFIYYMDKKDFLCKAKVDGYTVIDIMVWQIDHFKAEMDRGLSDMKYNGSKMVLRAFDTMLKMKKEPHKYKERMQMETGTDYPEKY